MPRPAIPTVQTDTPEVRVTEWRLPPGTATGHHRHAYDYVVVPMTDGDLTIVAAAGRSRSPIKAGQSPLRTQRVILADGRIEEWSVGQPDSILPSP